MVWLSKKKGFETINHLGKNNIPFLFIVSYDTNKIFAQPLDSLDEGIFYKLEEWRNYEVKKKTSSYTFSKTLIPPESCIPNAFIKIFIID